MVEGYPVHQLNNIIELSNTCTYTCYPSQQRNYNIMIRQDPRVYARCPSSATLNL